MDQGQAAMPLVRLRDSTLGFARFHDKHLLQNGDPENGEENTDRYR
jgi:hypothetical protein